MDPVNEIKNLLEQDALVIGTDRTLKNLKAGKVKKVFVSANPSQKLRADLAHYQNVSGVEVVQLDLPNDELGTICKKPFSIAVLSC